MPRDPDKTYKPSEPDATLAAKRATARAERQQPEKDYTPSHAPEHEPNDVPGKDEQRRIAKAVRERDAFEEDRVESTEGKIGRKRFAPVEVKAQQITVYRVVEHDGSLAGKDIAPSDGGGWVTETVQKSDDPEKAAQHLAAVINERRERAGRL